MSEDNYIIVEFDPEESDEIIERWKNALALYAEKNINNSFLLRLCVIKSLYFKATQLDLDDEKPIIGSEKDILDLVEEWIKTQTTKFTKNKIIISRNNIQKN